MHVHHPGSVRPPQGHRPSVGYLGEEWEDIKTGFIDHITTNVVIAGDFDETQRQRLAQVATRCPVHKTLKNGVAFSDKVRFV